MVPSEGPKRQPPGIGAAPRIALIYALISTSWIFGSDLLLKILLSEATVDRVTHFQTIKGIAFVLSTAVLIYFLIRDAFMRLRRSHEELQRSEEQFRRMVDWSPIGVFIAVERRFQYVNHAMMNILGAEVPEQLLGRPVFDFIHPDYHQAVRERARILMEQQIGVSLLEERYRKLDGSYIWVEVTAIPLEFEGKRASQVMVRDVHARKLAEAELKNLNASLGQRVADRTSELQQANDDLRGFSYTISHDLRAPLQQIARFAEQLAQNKQVRSDAEAREWSTRIVAAATRLDRLLLELLEYSQLARADIRLRRVSLILVVTEVVGQLRREPEMQNVQIDLREPMPWVLAHRPTLGLVIQSLLSNAVRFVAPGVRPAIVICATSGPEMVRLIVEDNGVGIDPMRAESLFDLFDEPAAGSEAEETAIGLAIVRRGVERMGGKVGVESTLGVGSRFWIELPKDPEAP